MPVIVKTKIDQATEIAQIAAEPRKKGLFGRIVSIIIMDIKRKIYGEKVLYPKEWEDYERWCKMVRGEK